MGEKEFNNKLKHWKLIGPDQKIIKSRYFFEVNDGWLLLISQLIEELISLGWNRKLHQCKEKWGGLRFYIESGNESIYKTITDFEKKSNNICEKCGNPGYTRFNSVWVVTMCEKCISNVRKKLEK